MKTLCTWSSLVLEKGLPMMHLAIPTMPFACVNHLCQLSIASMLIIDLPPRIKCWSPLCWSPLHWSPLCRLLIHPQDQQCWLPLCWSLIASVNCWSTPRINSVYCLCVDCLYIDHWLPLHQSLILPNQQCWLPLCQLPLHQLSIGPPTDFNFLIFNIRIIKNPIVLQVWHFSWFCGIQFWDCDCDLYHEKSFNNYYCCLCQTHE